MMKNKLGFWVLCGLAGLFAMPTIAEEMFDHNYPTAKTPPGCADMGAWVGLCRAGGKVEDIPQRPVSVTRTGAYTGGTGFGVVSSSAPNGTSSGAPGTTQERVVDLTNPVFATPNFAKVDLTLDENYYENLAPDLLSGGLFGSFSGAASKYIQGKIQGGINGALGGAGIQPPGIFVPGQGYYNESDYAMYSAGRGGQDFGTALTGVAINSGQRGINDMINKTTGDARQEINGWTSSSTGGQIYQRDPNNAGTPISNGGFYNNSSNVVDLGPASGYNGQGGNGSYTPSYGGGVYTGSSNAERGYAEVYPQTSGSSGGLYNSSSNVVDLGPANGGYSSGNSFFNANSAPSDAANLANRQIQGFFGGFTNPDRSSGVADESVLNY